MVFRLNEANEILSSATFVNDNKRAEQQENNEKLGVLVAHLQAQLNQANRDLESSVADKKELTSSTIHIITQLSACLRKIFVLFFRHILKLF